MTCPASPFALPESFVNPIALLLVEDCDRLPYEDALAVARAATETRLAKVGVAELQRGLREIGVRFDRSRKPQLDPEHGRYFRGRLKAVMDVADTSGVPVERLNGITGRLIPIKTFDAFARSEFEAVARPLGIELVWSPDAEPDGVTPEAGRNDPCPCGSGRKFKRCCG